MGVISFMEVMGTNNIPIIAAFFIGLMAAISPCPLATNITAIAYISKKIQHGKHTLLAGLFYTLGRMLTYTSIAALIVYIGVQTQTISLFLQGRIEKLLGPLLIVIGLIMLDIIKLPSFKDNEKVRKLKEKLAEKGYLGAFLLGVLFALAFCPISAVLFFGILIPLALRFADGLVIPAVFAFATGLPVIVFSFILVYSLSKLSTIMNKLQLFEKWMRRIVAFVFLAIGVYYVYIIWV